MAAPNSWGFSSILTTDFTKHAHGTLADHPPDPCHRRQVAVERRPSLGWYPLVVPAVGDGALPWALSGHDAVGVHRFGLTSSAPARFDPWRLLRKPGSLHRSALRLVVHGRRGGEIPSCWLELADAVACRRQAPVLLEALTAAEPTQTRLGFPTSDPEHEWLVPLLLLPGSHVRSDLPQIRQRLREEGTSTTLLPFLGAWPQWRDLLGRWLSSADDLAAASWAVVHHPVRPGPADRYLNLLATQLGCPLVPADQWEVFETEHPGYQPRPLALAPNRMSEALRQAGGSPALLEVPLVRSGLIDLLAALP
jgi:hypothetical protein